MTAPTRSRSVNAVPYDEGPGEWRIAAACRGTDPDRFSPDLKADRVTGDVDLRPLAATAWEFCHRCPVIQRCHDFAEQVPGTVGIWGGALRQLKSPGSPRTVRLPLVPTAPSCEAP